MKLTDFSDELNKALADFSLLIPEGVTVYPEAEPAFTEYLEKHPDINLVYADSDMIGAPAEWGLRPDFSPDLLRECPYIGGVLAVRTRLAGEIFVETDRVGLYEFLLRLTEKSSPDKTGHITKKLSEEKPLYDVYQAETEEEKALKQAHLERLGIAAQLEGVESNAQGADEKLRGNARTRVVYEPAGEPLVSVIIPSKDHYGILRQCIDSLQKFTDYKNYEIIVVDNGSLPQNRQMIEYYLCECGAKYIYQTRDFNFSAMCNAGAKAANGEYLLFLNDDVQISEGTWLSRMLGQCMQPHTGAVGAKLYYPGGSILQHCGVIDIATGPSHVLFQRDDASEHSYSCARNVFDFNYSAVTAACMMVSKENYEAAGGFDETLPIAYNDVDLCYKLLALGKFNVVRNDAVLFHHESLSRGQDTDDDEKRLRLDRELGRLHARHSSFMTADPYYNPALIDYDVTWEKQPVTAEVELLKGRPHLKKQGEAEVSEIGFGYHVHIEGSSDTHGVDVERYILFEGSDGDFIRAKVTSVAGDESRFFADVDRRQLRIDLKSYRLSLITEQGKNAFETPLNRMTLIRGKKKSEKLLCSVRHFGGQLPEENAGAVTFSIDELWADDSSALIRGFAFQKKDKRQEYYSTSVILKGGDGVYEVTVNKQDRMDVSWAFGNRPYIEESGFVCNISKGHIPAGRYQVGLLIRNCYTGSAYYVQTGRELVWM